MSRYREENVVLQASSGEQTDELMALRASVKQLRNEKDYLQRQYDLHYIPKKDVGCQPTVFYNPSLSAYTTPLIATPFGEMSSPSDERSENAQALSISSSHQAASAGAGSAQQ